MSDRLITGTSISIIAEKNLISKFKAEAGVAFVTKMTSMIQDLETSRSEMDSFRLQSHKGRPVNGIDMNVMVLGNSNWDIDKVKFEKIFITPSMEKSVSIFNQFYTNKRGMHRLEWAYGMVRKI